MAKDLEIKRGRNSKRTQHSSSSKQIQDRHSRKRKHNKSTSSHSCRESSGRKKSKRTDDDFSSITDIHSSPKEVIIPSILSEFPGVASELRQVAKHYIRRRKREWRGWAGLPNDIVERISGLLLAEDVTEYLRFRAVCHYWRESTAAPGSLERHFLPRNWIILMEDSDGLKNRVQLRRCFLNILNGKYLHVDVPELFDGTTHKLLSVLDGLLILMENSTSDMILLNPFTRSMTRFPALVPLFSITCPPSTRDIMDLIQLNLTGVNFAASSSSTIVITSGFERVAYANPDDQKWMLMVGKFEWASTLFFEGRLFATSVLGDLVQFVLPGGDELHPEPPQVINLIPSQCHGWHFLVECGGDMLLVFSSGNTVHLFKVDVEKRNLVPTTINSSHALFFTPVRSLSISTSTFPTIKGNTISFNTGPGYGGFCVYVPEGDHYVHSGSYGLPVRPFLLEKLFEYYCGHFLC